VRVCRPLGISTLSFAVSNTLLYKLHCVLCTRTGHPHTKAILNLGQSQNYIFNEYKTSGVSSGSKGDIVYSVLNNKVI
jgi:hypothetical protein